MLALVSLSLLGLALRGAAAFELHARNALGGLLVARQVGLPPSTQCDQICNPVMAAIGACTDLACLCTPTNLANLAQCLACSVAVQPSTQAAAQGVLDSFRAACGLPSVPVGAASATASPTATPLAPSSVAGGKTSNTGTGTSAPASQPSNPLARNGAGRVASGVGVVGLMVAVVIGFA